MTPVDVRYLSRITELEAKVVYLEGLLDAVMEEHCIHCHKCDECRAFDDGEDPADWWRDDEDKE